MFSTHQEGYSKLLKLNLTVVAENSVRTSLFAEGGLILI